MNKILDEKTEIWMQMERKTPEQIETADNFYNQEIMPLVEEDYISRNRNKVDAAIKYLIVSVGNSCEPIILNIRLFQPEKIMFLCTKDSEHTLNQVVSYAQLLPDCYEKCMVIPVESDRCYQAIKRCYTEWGRPQKICIDFTGGTKAMSTAAAMAGSFANIQVVYVGSTWNPKLRKPIPGSETLYYISNPLSVFGDLETEKAFALFDQYAYAGASEKIKEIHKNMPDPVIRQQLEYAGLLAQTYEEWDAFNFMNASNKMNELIHDLNRDRMHTNYLLMDFMETLKQQAKILENLIRIQRNMKGRNYEEILSDNESYTALVFTMYQCAIIREQQKKYDMATLLYYRLLEMIVQKRLYVYHLLTSDMNYENISVPAGQMPEWEALSKKEQISKLKETFSDIKNQVFRVQGASIPEKAGLLDGFIILSVLHDPVIEPYSANPEKFLNEVRSMADLRNSSIFAHGFHAIRRKNYQNFCKFVNKQLLIFCQTEGENFEKYMKQIKWINPKDSSNYPIG